MLNRVSTSSLVQIFLDFLSAMDFSYVTEENKKPTSVRGKVEDTEPAEHQPNSDLSLGRYLRTPSNLVEFGTIIWLILRCVELLCIAFEFFMSYPTCPV